MNGEPIESASECGGVIFCCRTPWFAAVVLDEDLLEMKWLRETKGSDFFAVLTSTQKMVYVLVVYGPQVEREEE